MTPSDHDRREQDDYRRPSHRGEEAGDHRHHARDDHGDAADAVGETPVLVVIERPRRLAAEGVVALDLGQVVTQQHQADADDHAVKIPRACILGEDAEDGESVVHVIQMKNR